VKNKFKILKNGQLKIKDSLMKDFILMDMF